MKAGSKGDEELALSGTDTANEADRKIFETGKIIQTFCPLFQLRLTNLNDFIIKFFHLGSHKN